jgi:predicted PurR-regulated permease PerM
MSGSPGARKGGPSKQPKLKGPGRSQRRAQADGPKPVEVAEAPRGSPELDNDKDQPEPSLSRDEAEIPVWVRRAMALFFTWAVGLLIAYWVLVKLKPLLLILVVALFLSLAMEPPVNRLVRRGWHRGGATALVWGAFLVATIGFVAAFGSVAFSQASQLVNNSAHYVHNVVDFLNRDFGTHINPKGLIKNLQSRNGTVQKFARNLANDAPNVALAIGKSLLEIILTFVFAAYLTVDGPRVRRAICSRLPPRRQQIVLDTWELAVQKTGAYLYSRGLQALVCTAAVWAFLFALGIPSSLALAIWVGVVSQFIPTVGTYLALVLPALVTLVSSPVDTIWVIAYLIGYQQFENYYLGPRIARFTLKIHPALTIGTVFAGALLLGPVGALLALPATAVIQALLSTYTEEQEVIETELTARPAARKRRVRIPRFSLRRRPPRTPPSSSEVPASRATSTHTSKSRRRSGAKPDGRAGTEHP